MKKGISAVIAASVLMTAACTSQITAEEKDVPLSNREKAVALLNSIETGDQQAASYVNPDKYIQHNLAVGDGLAGFGAVLQVLPEGSAKVDVQRVFQDGDYVFTHTDYNFFGPKVGFDVFRFEDGQIVEHWDNLAEKAAPNPSGRTQLDGQTEVTDLGKTEQNKALVADFVDTILMRGDFSQLGHFIDEGEENYLQHNSAIADGLSGLGEALKAMADQGITMVYSKNHIVLGEGNFVLSISEGRFGGKHVSFYDLFRVKENKIVEHWDVIEPIPAKDQWKNNNGKFGFKSE
ncbi:nuclear transport factor 2 family protein [Photobacterium sp. SDRW27]|uniref:nuclear transport factor 2 family protein n=1 Tax=Photobacterium obscurum TaxID=2829490 RepID=UPI0022438590|nr:nuclear transport factor 2 family protein [Photobacterium obscurum]MCW8329050.1 nuclear transport factor 2 family protein [Photobacterium obscurum]